MQVKLPEPLGLICPTGRPSIPRTPPDLSTLCFLQGTPASSSSSAPEDSGMFFSAVPKSQFSTAAGQTEGRLG